jgi:hypothetical protein
VELLRKKKEEDPENWERHLKRDMELDQEKEQRRAAKLAEKERLTAYVENWWREHHANQLEELKKKNRDEMESQDLLSQWSLSRSEGHLLEHPDQASTTLTGRHFSPVGGFAWSERACGDDPSTTRSEEEENQEDSPLSRKDGVFTEDGSEGHLLEHPAQASITLTGGHFSPMGGFAWSEGASGDDPSLLDQESVRAVFREGDEGCLG